VAGQKLFNAKITKKNPGEDQGVNVTGGDEERLSI